MANEIIYNPLLKKGLQELGDTAAQEAAIEDLKQKKVTKFFAFTDTLEPGEIAQYQGDDSVNGLVNGYFYKKTSTPIILPAGTQFFNNPATTVNLYGYNVTPGNFYLIEDITPEAGNTFFNYYIFQYTDKPNYLFFQEGFNTPTIGDRVWNRNNNTVVTVTNITYDEQFRTNVIISDGTTIIANSKSGHRVNSLLTFVDSNLNYYSIVNCSEMNVWTFIHYSISGSTFNLIDWFCIEFWPLQPTLSPTTIGSNAFQQVNAQPPTPGIVEESGILKVSLPVEFSDDVTVKGTQTVVTTEQIQSENDFIKLRYNNPFALASGDVSGISVENYDGNATDCILAVDKDGWARVGDNTGTLQKIATIAENPTNNQLLIYDNTNKLIKSIGNLYLSNNGYVTNGQSLTLIIPVSKIAYYQNAVWCVVGMGNIDSISLLRIKHGDVWSALIDDIVSTSYLSVASITVNNSIATVVLSCNVSGSNKFTFNALSTIPISSITVN